MPSIYRSVTDYIVASIASLQQNNSAITDFTIGSTAKTILEALGVQLSLQSLTANQLRLDMFLATATGSALDDKAADFLVFRKAAVQAAGTLTISIPGGAPGTILIPAGFAPLSTIASAGGVQQAVITTEDLTIPAAATTATVAAQALVGGAAGNLTGGVIVVPQTGVAGIASNGGFTIGTAFTSGADAETDTQLRIRVPIDVQGRVNGTRNAYLAAALRVPGVMSANVLGGGQARADASTVPAASVEVYYEGAASLAAAVQAAVTAAGVLNAAAVVGRTGGPIGPGLLDRLIASLTITCKIGSDIVAIGAAASQAAQDTVNAVAVGGTVYQSDVIQAVRTVAGVITVNVPFTNLCRFGAATVGDIAEPGDTYPNLLAADVTVAVLTI